MNRASNCYEPSWRCWREILIYKSINRSACIKGHLARDLNRRYGFKWGRERWGGVRPPFTYLLNPWPTLPRQKKSYDLPLPCPHFSILKCSTLIPVHTIFDLSVILLPALIPFCYHRKGFARNWPWKIRLRQMLGVRERPKFFAVNAAVLWQGMPSWQARTDQLINERSVKIIAH